MKILLKQLRHMDSLPNNRLCEICCKQINYIDWHNLANIKGDDSYPVHLKKKYVFVIYGNQ